MQLQIKSHATPVDHPEKTDTAKRGPYALPRTKLFPLYQHFSRRYVDGDL